MRARTGCLLLLVFLAASLVGCGPRVIQLPTPTVGMSSQGFPEETPQPGLPEQRQLILEWPQTIREKDSDLIVLTITGSELGTATATLSPGGERVKIPNLYDTHNIYAIARLDMAGLEAYREDIREQMHPGQPVTFRWSIRANEAGTYRGVVWLRLELVPKAGGPTEELLLLARPIEIQVITILGLSGQLARTLGGIGLLISTVLGYPFIQRWVEEWLKRRRGTGNPPPPSPTSGTGEVRPPAVGT